MRSSTRSCRRSKRACPCAPDDPALTPGPVLQHAGDVLLVEASRVPCRVRFGLLCGCPSARRCTDPRLMPNIVRATRSRSSHRWKASSSSLTLCTRPRPSRSSSCSRSCSRTRRMAISAPRTRARRSGRVGTTVRRLELGDCRRRGSLAACRPSLGALSLPLQHAQHSSFRSLTSPCRFVDVADRVWHTASDRNRRTSNCQRTPSRTGTTCSRSATRRRSVGRRSARLAAVAAAASDVPGHISPTQRPLRLVYGSGDPGPAPLVAFPFSAPSGLLLSPIIPVFLSV